MSSYSSTGNYDISQDEYSDAEALELRREFDQLVSQRKIYEKTWDDLTEYVAPSQGAFIYKQQKYDPQRKSYRRLDSTPATVARQLMAKVNAEMTGNSTRWFDWRDPNPDIDKIEKVRRCLYDLSDKAYNILNNGSFRTAHIEALLNWIVYGTGCLEAYTDDDKDMDQEGPCFKAIPLREIYIQENDDGMVDVIYRKFIYNYRQMCQFFGEETIPGDIHESCINDQYREFEIVHAVRPNDDYDPSKKRNDKFKFESKYLLMGSATVTGPGVGSPTGSSNKLLKVGYFKRNPYIVFRFWKRPGEVYGGSCAMDCLPDIRILNIMVEAYLRILQRKSEPPMMMEHDSVILPLKLIPNGLTMGGVKDGRRQLMEVFEDRGGDEIILQAIELKKQQIRTAFFIDPRMGQDKSVRTAAEVNKRTDEELIGITPFLARLEVEYLIPTLDFVLDYVLEKNKGQYAIQIPQELHGRKPKIQFSAPLAQTQRGQELQNLVQLLQMTQNIGQIDPTVIQHLDMNTVFTELVDLLSVNMDVVVPAEVVQAKQAAAAKQQQQQQAMQNMNVGAQTASGALSNMSKAGLVGRSDLGLPELSQGNQ